MKLIDALNQFERINIAKYLTWLPEIWPENARLITTSIEGIETKTLEIRKDVTTLELERLSEEDGNEIIDRIDGR